MNSLRNIFQLGGGNGQLCRELPNQTRCTSIPEDVWSWELVNDGNDRSAPNISGWFGRQGGGVQFELQGADTCFTLGDPGTGQNRSPQPWGDAMDQRPMDNEGEGTTPAPRGQAMQATTRVPTLPYSGMSAALQKWGTGDKGSQGRELAWQRGVEGDKTKITQFQKMIGPLQEFKTHLFMKKGSAFCTIIHSPTKFMALNKATQHLQGCFTGLIGDCTLTRNPTPILLPTQKNLAMGKGNGGHGWACHDSVL